MQESLSDGLTSLMSVAKKFASHYEDNDLTPAAGVLSDSNVRLVRVLIASKGRFKSQH
jgi:hypothetical protein